MNHVPYEHACKHSRNHTCDMDPEMKAKITSAINVIYTAQRCEGSLLLCACRALSLAEAELRGEHAEIVCCIACYQAIEATVDVLRARDV